MLIPVCVSYEIYSYMKNNDRNKSLKEIAFYVPSPKNEYLTFTDSYSANSVVIFMAFVRKNKSYIYSIKWAIKELTGIKKLDRSKIWCVCFLDDSGMRDFYPYMLRYRLNIDYCFNIKYSDNIVKVFSDYCYYVSKFSYHNKQKTSKILSFQDWCKKWKHSPKKLLY